MCYNSVADEFNKREVLEVPRKRKKKGNVLEDFFESNMCYKCGNCQYVGEGGYVCDVHMRIVIDDWMPTEEFYCCGGEDYEEGDY